MTEDIKSPQFPESIFEGTLSSWLKKEGDEIKQDEVLAEIETDKVVIEVTAQSDGVMEKILVEEGSTIKSSDIIGRYVKGDAPIAPEKTESTKKEPKKTAERVEKKPIKEITTTEKPETQKSAKQKGFRMGPAAKKLLNEKDVDLADVETSSKKNVVTKKDLLDAASKKPEQKENIDPIVDDNNIKRVPMTRLRSVVAKRLLESQFSTASLTTFNEVDLYEVKKLREKYRDSFEEKFGVKLGFMGMFLKASSLALQDMPIVNASIDGNDIVYHGSQDIGVAVSTEKGLVVPVLKNADEMSFADIENEIKKLSDKAKNGNLTIEDLQGGTFTISNGGVYGSMLSTPILNPPQSGVLGMHNIVERTVVENGEIKIKPVMYLALSYDHRIIDGKDSVSFLKTIKENLEDPRRLFLDL